jgi:hypothetical protein
MIHSGASLFAFRSAENCVTLRATEIRTTADDDLDGIHTLLAAYEPRATDVNSSLLPGVIVAADDHGRVV